MANRSKPKQTSILSFFENRSSVMNNNNENEVDVNSINTQNECKGEASCSEPQFEELTLAGIQAGNQHEGIRTQRKFILSYT